MIQLPMSGAGKNTSFSRRLCHKNICMDSISNEQDLIAVYDVYYGKIFAFLFRSVLDHELAEDLTSNTFLKALDYIKRKPKFIENFSAWLYKIASNELLLYYRKKKGVKFIEMEKAEEVLALHIAEHNPHSLEGFADFLTAREILEDLPAGDRVLLELHFFEKLSYREIAPIVDKNENTVRSTVSRIISRLKKKYGVSGEPDEA